MDITSFHPVLATNDVAALIDVITPISPSEEYLAQFSAEALEETQGGAA